MKDPNERRVLLATLLSLLVSMVWLMVVRQRTPPPEEAPTEVAGSPTTPAGAAPAPGVTPPEASTPVASAPCDDRTLPLKTDAVHLTVATCGGAIRSIEIPAVGAPIAVTPLWTWVWGRVTGGLSGPWQAYVFEEGVEALVSESGHFGLAGRGDLDLAPSLARGWEPIAEEGGLMLRSTSSDGLTITRTLRPSAEAPDLLELSVRWESTVPLMGPLWVALSDRFVASSDPYSADLRLMAVQDEELTTVTSPEDLVADPIRSSAPLQWLGVSDRYFLAALLPDEPAKFQSALQAVKLPAADGASGADPRVALAAFATLNQDLSPGTPVEARFRLYVGPKSVERLAAVDPSLEEAGTLGFWGFFAKILLFFLHLFQAGIHNWGASIVALTFMVRLAFYPLSAKAFKSAKAMQVVQPQLKALQEKYADDREGLNREMVKLFAEHNVNPLSGCFPMLVQMPVFFALYSALLNTPDLYQANFLYLHDLSAPDPYGLLPALMAVGMVVQQRMTPMTGMDPTQQTMMRLMPLLFAGFMFSVPAGLSVYYAVNTVLAIAQQWYNTRTYGPMTPATTTTPSTPASQAGG